MCGWQMPLYPVKNTGSRIACRNRGCNRLKKTGKPQFTRFQPVLVMGGRQKKLGGEDPEFVWSGGTTMPITKQYTFTLNIGF